MVSLYKVSEIAVVWRPMLSQQMVAPVGEGDFVSPASLWSSYVQTIARTLIPVNRSGGESSFHFCC